MSDPKRKMADRILEENGVTVIQGGTAKVDEPIVGTLSSKTTPADFRRFEAIARLRRTNRDN